MSQCPTCGVIRMSEEATREFLEALESAKLPSDWQPIGTAPGDGAPILGWDGHDSTTVYCVGGHWFLCVPGAYAQDDEFIPTHWMPLPPPPEAQG